MTAEVPRRAWGRGHPGGPSGPGYSCDVHVRGYKQDGDHHDAGPSSLELSTLGSKPLSSTVPPGWGGHITDLGSWACTQVNSERDAE